MTDTKISVLDIIEDTTADGPGFRTAIYAAGCIHKCPGCHNPQSWDVAAGNPVEVDTLLETILRNEFSDVTFTGGDPLLQPEGFTALAKQIKTHSHKTIWCYTGYTYETIQHHEKIKKLLPYIDVLVDGRFVETLKDESLLFKGSRNQRLINVRKSLEKGRVVLYEYNPFPWMSELFV